MNNQKPFERYLDGLSFEVTRRCNMDCIFCSRGKAQHLDITKEIIDKALDEVSNTMIGSLRISGGEPFLAPKVIKYLFEQIIKRNIYICKVGIFTNGSIIQPDFIDIFNSMLSYIKQRALEYPLLQNWFWSSHIPIYKGTKNKKISIIVSDVEHGEIDTNEVIEYYRQIKNEDFAIVLQSDSIKEIGKLILDGNALENCKQILGDNVSLEQVIYIDNAYSFIRKFTDEKNKQLCELFENNDYIDKTITISANGNVFPGYMLSYKRVDMSPMLNINDCNNDFFERIKYFCWNNPICEKAKEVITEYKAIQVCKEHGIDVSNIDEGYLAVSRWAVDVINLVYIPLFRQIHRAFSYLDIDEVELVSTAKLVLYLYNIGIPKDYISAYLCRCSRINKDVVKTPELCEKILDNFGDNRRVLDKITV